jgi:hypothetical protein
MTEARTNVIAKIMLLSILVSSNCAGAQTLPTTEQFDASLRTCAAGQHIQINADLLGSISSIYSAQRTQGALSFQNRQRALDLRHIGYMSSA